MEIAGIVRCSSSPWSSPLYMVPKPDGTWRPCGDFGHLDTATVPDRYPLPAVVDFSARIAGSMFFSKLDLQKGYFQIPMRPADIPKTAIITPFGLFEFLCLPFGLRNAAQTFQRMMDRIFGYLPFCFIYLDDILVFSSSLADHQLHLCRILDLCSSMASPSTWRSVFLLLLKLSILDSQSPALGLLLSISSSMPSLLFCLQRTAQSCSSSLGWYILQEVYMWSCSDPPPSELMLCVGIPRTSLGPPRWTPPLSLPSLPWLWCLP